jgi:hypothetical protein
VGKEAWCRSQGILRSTLNSCLVRVQRAEAALASPVASGFIAVHPPRSAAPVSGELRLALGGEVQVHGLDLAGVIMVLRALREDRS